MQLPDFCFGRRKKIVDKPSDLPILATRTITMSISSVKTQSNVKPKPTSISALPDSDNLQLNIPPAEQSAKTSQIQDLQKSDPGVSPWPLLEKLIRVPTPAGYKSKLSLRIYYLLAVLDAHQGDRQFSSPSILRLALECRVSERQIKRWLAKLKRLKYIWVDGRGKRNRYRVIRTRKMPDYVFVDPRWVYRLGLSINEAVVLGYVYFKHNHKPETWFSIRRAVWDLGLSYNTIRRCLAVLAALELFPIRPGRQSGGRTNRYQLTGLGWIISWENYPKQARPKCPLLRNTSAAQCYSFANFSRKGGLSNQLEPGYSPDQDQKIYELLLRARVNRIVAKPVAFQWRGYIKSVEQAILNAAYLFSADAETLRRHNLTRPRGTLIAYVIGTLNGAYSEGHRVKPSKLAKEGEAKRKVKLAAAAAGQPPEAELKKLRQYAENVLKPCLTKLHPLGKLPILAQYTPICDKKADDALLTRTQAAARRNSRSYQKYANLGQKLHISTGFDK